MPRLLHLSDIHFGAENPAAVGEAAAFIRRESFDLLVVTGDITQYGSVLEFKAAERWFTALPGPMMFTPGNHDTPYADLGARLTRPFARYEAGFGLSDDGTFEGGGLKVRAINTARGAQIRLNWSKGAIGLGHARRAAKSLADAPGSALRVVICHHPLVEVTGGPMTGGVRGGTHAAEALARGGVDLILCGHIHTAFAVTLPFADGRTYLAGAATLSLRERGAPAGFNVIEADARTITVTAMAWTGSHFEPARTWALPRRDPQTP
jgi:3',5'-cyclic AMP phosphodiesterase CpdA